MFKSWKPQSELHSNKAEGADHRGLLRSPGETKVVTSAQWIHSRVDQSRFTQRHFQRKHDRKCSNYEFDTEFKRSSRKSFYGCHHGRKNICSVSRSKFLVLTGIFIYHDIRYLSCLAFIKGSQQTFSPACFSLSYFSSPQPPASASLKLQEGTHHRDWCSRFWQIWTRSLETNPPRHQIPFTLGLSLWALLSLHFGCWKFSEPHQDPTHTLRTVFYHPELLYLTVEPSFLEVLNHPLGAALKNSSRYMRIKPMT